MQRKRGDNRSKIELLPPMTFKGVVEDTIDVPWHEIHFMTGKEIRDRGDRKILDAYMKSKTLTGQNYFFPGNEKL